MGDSMINTRIELEAPVDAIKRSLTDLLGKVMNTWSKEKVSTVVSTDEVTLLDGKYYITPHLYQHDSVYDRDREK